MTDLPEPLTPSDCDLFGFCWSPIFGDELFTGPWRKHSLKDPRGANAALHLWWQSMKQVPAASLDDDEAELCYLAGLGQDIKSFRKHRPVIMDGYVLCSDGRWYHPWLADIALDAYNRKLRSQEDADRSHAQRHTATERMRRWRASQNGVHPPEKPNGHSPPERNDVTRHGDADCASHHASHHASRDGPVASLMASRDAAGVARARAYLDIRKKTEPPRSPPVTGGAERRGRKRKAFHGAEPSEPLTINGKVEEFEPWLRRISDG